MVTAKAIEDSSYAKTSAIPVKATGTEVNTGTDDAKFVTAKAVQDSNLLRKTGGVMTGALEPADHGTNTNPEVAAGVS